MWLIDTQNLISSAVFQLTGYLKETTEWPYLYEWI